MHIQSFWDSDETIARLTPREHHIAIPGYVYGGLSASLIDCHGTGTAAAAAYRAAGRDMESVPALWFVTASLKVDYLRPTPMGVELEARGRIHELADRKIVVRVIIMALSKICAKGEVVAVPMPESMRGVLHERA